MPKNFVNYQLEMTPENAGLIDKVNKLIIANYGDEAEEVNTEAANDTPTKKADKKADKKASSAKISFSAFKKAARAAAKEHGKEWPLEVLEDAGVDIGEKPLAKAISAAVEDDYAEIMATWEAGPTDSDSEEEEEDDGFGDDDEDEEDDAVITADAVKAALKAHAKDVDREEAKAIMKKHGAAQLSDVAKCTPKQLTAIMKALA